MGGRRPRLTRTPGGTGTVRTPAAGRDGRRRAPALAAAAAAVTTTGPAPPVEPSSAPMAPGRGRDREGRRVDNRSGSRRNSRRSQAPAAASGGGDWNNRSSSGPLAEIVMSSPSVSPTPSRSPEPRPSSSRPAGAESAAGAAPVPPLLDSVDFGPAKWSWEGPDVPKQGGGPAAGSGGGADGGRSAVGSADLGYVRIYAKQDLLTALKVSAFSA